MTSFIYNDYKYESIQYELQLFSILDGDLYRNDVIPLPNDMKYIGHVVYSPDNNFVISYSKTLPVTQCWISILSGDGERIRTFEPEFESLIKNPGAFPFDIDDDGNIFVADYNGGNVIWLNSNLTDYRIIRQRSHEIESPCNILYIPEKRQLLVQERKGVGPVGFLYSVYMFHLSPCHLVQQRK